MLNTSFLFAKSCILMLFASISARGLTTGSKHRRLDFNFKPWVMPERRSLNVKQPMKTAVLCHGCHLQSQDWEAIMWGDVNEQKQGRLPHATLLAMKENASLFIIGSGGSFSSDGSSEGEITLQYLRKQLPSICDFNIINQHMTNDGISSAQLTELMERIIVCETESVNTLQEVEHACELMSTCGIERVILVSSPTHIARCIRDACSVFNRRDYHPLITASPSYTCYAGSSPSDVCVVEPAHRGDRDKRFDGALGYHRLFPRALAIPLDKRHSFAQELDMLIHKYEK